MNNIIQFRKPTAAELSLIEYAHSRLELKNLVTLMEFKFRTKYWTEEALLQVMQELNLKPYVPTHHQV